ncbi:MAG: LicD family protein [Parachlamydiales bacterium]|nr:LicD family protein [Parachlamydiales bacterium]
MLDRLWDVIIDSMITCFMPLVCSYYAISANIFINVSAQNATGLERLGNNLLAPVQFILAGKEAKPMPDGSWQFVQRFDYDHGFWYKTASSIVFLPPSIVLGTVVKAISLLDSDARSHHQQLTAARYTTEVHSNVAAYEKMGLDVAAISGLLTPLGCQRRPGDENVLKIEKEALADIGKALTDAGIPWWVDCGTCLGAYRYGGVIPWDCDIDVAVLLPDFENVFHALNRLDPKKYIIQDWSSREHPNSYIKVFVRKSVTLIDIYHFAIDETSKQLRYILSLENNMFFPEWWKIRERRFKEPVAFDTVFPLKRAQFDGIEVFVPNDTKKYLQRCYGENLDPVKVYNPVSNLYEKDLSHPYWQRIYAH